MKQPQKLFRRIKRRAKALLPILRVLNRWSGLIKMRCGLAWLLYRLCEITFLPSLLIIQNKLSIIPMRYALFLFLALTSSLLKAQAPLRLFTEEVFYAPEPTTPITDLGALTPENAASVVLKFTEDLKLSNTDSWTVGDITHFHVQEDLTSSDLRCRVGASPDSGVPHPTEPEQQLDNPLVSSFGHLTLPAGSLWTLQETPLISLNYKRISFEIWPTFQSLRHSPQHVLALMDAIGPIHIRCVTRRRHRQSLSGTPLSALEKLLGARVFELRPRVHTL